MACGTSNLTASQDEQVHLFLFLHGLWGNPNHMLTVEKAVKRTITLISSEKIVTLKPSSFRFWKTYDGIERCAENTIADLFYEIETLKHKNRRRITKISIIGYSLGGLISRYVVGSLYELGFFEEVSPVFFCTFATPHVGVHFFKDAIFDKMANWMGKCLFGRTGLQLFLEDAESLLVEMTNPKTRFIKGLNLFEKRILLANIKNDRSVPFYTSFITEFSPFDSLSSINIQYFEKMPSARVNNVTVWPKFVDLRRSNKIHGLAAKHRNVQEATSILRSNFIIRYTLLLVAALVLFPIYLPLIVCLSLYVSGYSVVKVKVISGPDNIEHWAAVRLSVFHGGHMDTEHSEKGDSRRQERRNLWRHESLKGDTSSMTENVMDHVLAVEEKFVNDSSVVIEEEKSTDGEIGGGGVENKTSGRVETFYEKVAGELSFVSSSEDSYSEIAIQDMAHKKSILPRILGWKATIEIPVLEYDRIIRKHQNLLKWNNEANIPLFETKALLPFSENQHTIIKNLNKLDWIKIPVFHDLFNAHDSIVARRGGMRNPKGTCTLFFWASILRTHILDKGAD